MFYQYHFQLNFCILKTTHFFLIKIEIENYQDISQRAKRFLYASPTHPHSPPHSLIFSSSTHPLPSVQQEQFPSTFACQPSLVVIMNPPSHQLLLLLCGSGAGSKAVPHRPIPPHPLVHTSTATERNREDMRGGCDHGNFELSSSVVMPYEYECPCDCEAERSLEPVHLH